MNNLVMNNLDQHLEQLGLYGIFILFTLGLRIGELAALRFSDIAYESKFLFI